MEYENSLSIIYHGLPVRIDFKKEKDKVIVYAGDEKIKVGTYTNDQLIDLITNEVKLAIAIEERMEEDEE